MVASHVVRSQGGPQDVQEAFRILAAGAPSAARALIEVIEESDSDTARVTAATALLDRMGISARQQLDVRHVVPDDFREKTALEEVDSSITIKRRLLELKSAQQIQEQILNPVFDQDDEILEAVLVEEDMA